MLPWYDRPGGQKVGVTAEMSLHRTRAGSVCYLWLRGDFPLPLRQLQPSDQTTVSRQLTHHLLYWGIAMIVCHCAALTGSGHFTPTHSAATQVSFRIHTGAQDTHEGIHESRSTKEQSTMPPVEDRTFTCRQCAWKRPGSKARVNDAVKSHGRADSAAHAM